MSMSQSVRVTGVVVTAEQRHGVKNGQDWTLTTCKVLVGGAGIAEVTMPFGQTVAPAKGELVDWMCEVDESPTFGAQIRAVSAWSDES